SDARLTKDLVCNGDGLIVSGGVRLDMNQHSLAGFKDSSGVRIVGDRATVGNGLIRDFRTGVSGNTNGSTVDEVSIATNRESIEINDNDNVITRNLIVNNGVGITVSGDRNTVNDRNAVFGNSARGIDVRGNGNLVEN